MSEATTAVGRHGHALTGVARSVKMKAQARVAFDTAGSIARAARIEQPMAGSIPRNYPKGPTPTVLLSAPPTLALPTLPPAPQRTILTGYYSRSKEAFSRGS